MTKIAVFVIAVTCLSGAFHYLIAIDSIHHDHVTSVLEKDYLESQAYIHESLSVLWDLTSLLVDFKSEEYIARGESISADRWENTLDQLFHEYQYDGQYNPNLSYAENVSRFQEEYAEKIAEARNRLIKDDLREFRLLLQKLESLEGAIFYATDGSHVFANTMMNKRAQFESFPAHFLFEGIKLDIFPKELENHHAFYPLKSRLNELDLENAVVYLAFTEQFLHEKAKEWQEYKSIVLDNLYKIAGCALGFLLAFIYLIMVAGKKSFRDEKVHFYAGDRIYNDVRIVMAIVLITIYAAFIDSLSLDVSKIIVPVLVPIMALTLYVILTCVKQIKNRTFLKHTLIYSLMEKFIRFIGQVYSSGSIGVKTVLLVVGYPIVIALTFFMFPITIGAAAWFAFKKVKAFQAIQEGVEQIKRGDLHHRIDIEEQGELKRLAENINRITEGLNKAVENELKSERLKTELITNVSHDIRTPLTSIITYVDLLKNEQNPEKMKEYIHILEQKSKRLKVLTDDLFEAAKASSGNIPVQLEKIDIVSLLNQGLGEVSDKIEAHDLDFRVKYPEEKIYLSADGKLLWRAMENLLSNIFKYALRGSRVYISIEDLGRECLITFKNISAHELNISAEELLERFKRGDESRTSEGSGLGLSIAKDLIQIQKGRFQIHVDGDLFKVMMYLPKYDAEDN